MKLGPGIYDDVSHEEYHRDPAVTPSLSASVAKILCEHSPKHAWQAHPRLGGGHTEDDDTDATDRGTIVHKLLLGRGPDVVEVEANDWRTKAAKEARDAARAAGKVPVIAARMGAMRAAATALESRLLHSMVSFREGRSEVTAIWQSMGVLCRCRIDYLLVGDGAVLITDLKTAESANPIGVGAKMVNYGADIQAAAYVEAVETLMPELAGRVRIRFAYVECRAPFEASVSEPSGEMLELGRRKWRAAKSAWQRCIESGEWPGYPTDVQRAEPPTWALANEMDRQTERMENSNDSAPF
jgi:hypothetical protein